MITHDHGYQGHYVLTLDGNFQNLQNGVGGSEVVVMLSTGRHDCSGKSIFEKDILQTESGQRCICEYVPATASYCLFPLVGSTAPSLPQRTDAGSRPTVMPPRIAKLACK
jgi:hypothetical protein